MQGLRACTKNSSTHKLRHAARAVCAKPHPLWTLRETDAWFYLQVCSIYNDAMRPSAGAA